MKISIKFLSIVFLAFGICLLLVFMAIRTQVNLSNNFLEDRNAKEKRVFDSYNQLKFDELKRLVSDYAIWDELAQFCSLKDSNWANYNVKSMLNSYKLSAVWVYNLNEEMLYAAFTSSKSKNVFENSVIKKLAEKDVYRFWKKVNNSYYINYGASIRNSRDVHRLGKKFGYLIIAKEIDTNFVNDLKDFLSGDIYMKSTFQPFQNKNEVVMDTMKDEQDKPIGYFINSNANSKIIEIINFNKNLFNIILIGAIVLLMLVFGSFYWWVIRPLKKITSWLNVFHPNFDLSKHKRFSEFETISMVMHAQTQNQKKLNEEILARQKAQEELQKNQQLLSSTIKSIDDIIFIVDENLIFTEFLNEENAEKFKFTSDVFIGKTIYEIWLPEEILEKYLDAIEEIKISKRTEKFEYHLEAFGTQFSYSVKISPRIENNHKITGYTIVCRDITIPHKTNNFNKELNVNLHELSFNYNSLPEIIIDVDSNQIIEVNQAYLKLSNHAESEVQNHSLWEFPYFNELFSGKMEFIELQASDCNYVFNKRISFSNKKIVACDIYSYSFMHNSKRLIKLIFVVKFQKQSKYI